MGSGLQETCVFISLQSTALVLFFKTRGVTVKIQGKRISFLLGITKGYIFCPELLQSHGIFPYSWWEWLPKEPVAVCILVYFNSWRQLRSQPRPPALLFPVPAPVPGSSKQPSSVFPYTQCHSLSPLPSSGESKSCSTAAASVCLPVPQLQKPLYLQLEVTSSPQL